MTMNWLKGPQGFRWVLIGQEAGFDQTWEDVFGNSELFTSTLYDNNGGSGLEPNEVLNSYPPWRRFSDAIVGGDWDFAEWSFRTNDGFFSQIEWSVDEPDDEADISEWWQKRVSELNEHFDTSSWVIFATVRFDEEPDETRQLFIQKVSA